MLFTAEQLRNPGFVEFDEVNQKILTFCSETQIYKVWSMAEPAQMIFQIDNRRIDEIKISPGIMLLVLAKRHNYVRAIVPLSHSRGPHVQWQVPLKVLSIETGEMLREFKQLIRRGESIVVMEQFNQKLLFKQVCQAAKRSPARESFVLAHTIR
eukprot:scaffold215578_cov29-Tisochrysis_lutea.AAC.1